MSGDPHLKNGVMPFVSMGPNFLAARREKGPEGRVGRQDETKSLGQRGHFSDKFVRSIYYCSVTSSTRMASIDYGVTCVV